MSSGYHVSTVLELKEYFHTVSRFLEQKCMHYFQVTNVKTKSKGGKGA